MREPSLSVNSLADTGTDRLCACSDATRTNSLSLHVPMVLLSVKADRADVNETVPLMTANSLCGSAAALAAERTEPDSIVPDQSQLVKSSHNASVYDTHVRYAYVSRAWVNVHARWPCCHTNAHVWRVESATNPHIFGGIFLRGSNRLAPGRA